MHSCIYEGIVTHCRRRPVRHEFQYRLYMVYLDLDELPELVGPGRLIANRRFAGRAFLPSDHLFDRSQPLGDEVRRLIQQQTGQSPRGPIRLLTQLRLLGYYFSPLNLFYVFDEHDQYVEYVVAEVNNTPWKQRHCYVLPGGLSARDDDRLRFQHAKQFHVSPFMGMDMQYRWQLTQPAEQLAVQLANYEGKNTDFMFTSRMALERRELSRRQLRWMTLRYPLMTAKITAAIYLHALKLWWKRCPFYPHPNKQRPIGNDLSSGTKESPTHHNAVR